MTDAPIPLRDSTGRWLKGASGNPVGPKPQPTSRRQLRQMIEADVPAIIEKLRELALAGDVHASRTLLERALPPMRPDTELVVIEGLDTAKTLSEKAQCVIAAVARGNLSPDVGERLLSSLAACAKIIEVDELSRRVSVLEGTTEPEQLA